MLLGMVAVRKSCGVCFLDEWKSTHELQSFASQVCLPETAFVIPSKKNNWAIRWFSTSHEVDLCGHATLAAAYCLSKTNDIHEINFSSKSGVLKTIVHSDETVSITLPASHARTSKLSAQLVEGLGAYPEGVWKGANYLCLFESEEIIQSLQPDFTVLRSIKETVGVIVTAPSTCKDYDFASGILLRELAFVKIMPQDLPIVCLYLFGRRGFPSKGCMRFSYRKEGERFMVKTWVRK